MKRGKETVIESIRIRTSNWPTWEKECVSWRTCATSETLLESTVVYTDFIEPVWIDSTRIDEWFKWSIHERRNRRKNNNYDGDLINVSRK